MLNQMIYKAVTGTMRKLNYIVPTRACPSISTVPFCVKSRDHAISSVNIRTTNAIKLSKAILIHPTKRA